MNKEEYQKALKSIKWVTKRNSIKKRDGNKCVKCGYKDKLEVHHTYYLIGKMPWEVPDDCLITLCRTCHEKEHTGRDISTFMRNTPPKQKEIKKPTAKKKVKHKAPRKERREANKKLEAKKKAKFILSKADKELQKKYDDIREKGKLPESTYTPPKSQKRKKKNK